MHETLWEDTKAVPCVLDDEMVALIDQQLAYNDEIA